jgi:hypothetical protein
MPSSRLALPSTISAHGGAIHLSGLHHHSKNPSFTYLLPYWEQTISPTKQTFPPFWTLLEYEKCHSTYLRKEVRMAGLPPKDLVVKPLKSSSVPAWPPGQLVPPRKYCVTRSANLSRGCVAPNARFFAAKANVEAKSEFRFLINSLPHTTKSNGDP